MFKENRLQFSFFFLLILLGSWFILDKVVPPIHAFTVQYIQWPRILILMGVGIFFFGMLIDAPDMFVPALALASVGGLLSYQETHGGFVSSWYTWALLPVFIGIGMICAGLFEEEDSTQNLKNGFILIGIGAIPFIIFSALFGGWNLFGR